MRKLIFIIFSIISISANSQIVNRFRDSTWFAKGVRFDSAIYLIKGAGSNKILSSDANGRASWQTTQIVKINDSTYVFTSGTSVLGDTIKIHSVGGGGSGTVTSVGSGIGLLGGTITTSGTLRVDTSNITTKTYLNSALLAYATKVSLNDSVNILRILINTKASTQNLADTAIVLRSLIGNVKDTQSLYLHTNPTDFKVGITRGNELTFYYSVDSVKIVGDSLIQYKYNDRHSYFIGSGGGSGIDSIYYSRTYAQLRAAMTAHALNKGASYKMTDFATIYDQSISDVTKTASGEVIVLVANSDSTFSPTVSSLDFPTDIIYYDITVDATFVNGAPCKGKITYREDEKGNSAYFDFRKILMYNLNTSAEALAFDVSTSTLNKNTIPSALSIGIVGAEFPVSYIVGASTNNGDNLCLGAYFLDIFSKNYSNQITVSTVTGLAFNNTGNIIESSTIGGILTGNNANSITESAITGGMVNNTKVTLNVTPIGGRFTSNVNIEADSCSIVGNMDSNNNGIWNNTTFGENVSKCVEVNFNNSTIGGRIDRLINCAILTDTIGGRLFWNQNILVTNTYVNGDLQGANGLTITTTHADCNVESVNGVTMFNSQYGFTGCTIDGTTSGSIFGNVRVDCMVTNKVISEALYPELFDITYVKTIFKGSNGLYYYRYFNGLTDVVTQII